MYIKGIQTDDFCVWHGTLFNKSNNKDCEIEIVLQEIYLRFDC